MFSLPYDIMCGYYDSGFDPESPVSEIRTVEKYEIEFFTDDGLESFLDENAIMIKRDHVLIAKPGQVRFSRLPFKTAYVKFNAEGEIAKRLSEAADYFPSLHRRLILDNINEIILLCEKGETLLMYSRLLSFINLILSDSRPKSRENYAVLEAKRYIEKNCGDKLTLKNIAEHVSFSNVYFHNMFLNSVGKTPHKYLIECRVENAKKLLWNTETSLGDIAEKCGFCNQQHLNKLFKQETGMTPGEYRRRFMNRYIGSDR